MPVSGKNIFLFIGRTLPFLYLSFFFIISIVEHTERSRAPTQVSPAAIRAYSVVKRSIESLKAKPIESIVLVNSGEHCPTGYGFETLAIWEPVDYCACLSSVTPGECGGDKVGCRAEKNVRKSVSIWDGKGICIRQFNGERAQPRDESAWTCKDKLVACASGYCAESLQQCPYTALSVQDSNVQLQTPNPYKDFTKIGDFMASTENALFASKSISTGRSINKLGVSFGSIPCVESNIDPKRGYKPDLAISKRSSEPGCGTYGQSKHITVPLSQKPEGETWIENGHGLYFAELPGYESFASGEEAILFAELKPRLKHHATCHQLYSQNVIAYNGDNSAIFWERGFVNIFTYSIVGLALALFGCYFCMKQNSDSADSQQSLSYCTFWFIHLICIVLAITHIVISALCMSEINEYYSYHEYIKNYTDLECFQDAGILDAWKNYYSFSIAGLSRVYFWSELCLWVSVAFLIIELIYIIWYAFGYRCSQKIDEEESHLISANKLRS